MNSFDSALVLWLNGLSGNVRVIDDLLRVVASDYLMPLLFSIAMVGLWFAGRNAAERRRFQVATLVGISSIGISNLAVFAINSLWFRPRPFVDLGNDLNLLFYQATDSSFPANPVAIGFAAGAAAWLASRRLGIWLLAGALLYGISRIYAGVFYPTDIAGGAAVGVLVVLGTLRLKDLLEPAVSLFIRVVRGLSLA